MSELVSAARNGEMHIGDHNRRDIASAIVDALDRLSAWRIARTTPTTDAPWPIGTETQPGSRVFFLAPWPSAPLDDDDDEDE
jgi:hypothetical protein